MNQEKVNLEKKEIDSKLDKMKKKKATVITMLSRNLKASQELKSSLAIFALSTGSVMHSFSFSWFLHAFSCGLGQLKPISIMKLLLHSKSPSKIECIYLKFSFKYRKYIWKLTIDFLIQLSVSAFLKSQKNSITSGVFLRRTLCFY